MGVLASAATVQAQGAGAHVPFENFTPGACAVAPGLIDRLAWREFVDNTVYTPARDTTSKLSSDSVRICAGAFGGATNSDWELLNLARVQLIQAEDSLARATAERHLRVVGSSPEKRAWALYLIATDNLSARPARFATAGTAISDLDKLGAPAGKARLLAHFASARAAQRYHDDKRTVAEANATIAIWKTLPQRLGLQLSTQMASAFLMKAEIALRLDGIAPAKAIIDTADRVVPANAGMARRMIEVYRKLYTILGRTAAPIEAQFWFGNDGQALTAPRPSTGRVTMISSAAHACGAPCRERYKGLRRFGERFRGRLDIVNMTKTLGFHSDTAPIAPIDEARYDSSYFLGKVSLPGTVAVYETKYTWIPDGRRRNQPTPQERNYPYASVVVVDRKGIVRYASDGWNPQLEEPLAQFIEKLIAEP